VRCFEKGVVNCFIALSCPNIHAASYVFLGHKLIMNSCYLFGNLYFIHIGEPLKLNNKNNTRAEKSPQCAEPAQREKSRIAKELKKSFRTNNIYTYTLSA